MIGLDESLAMGSRAAQIAQAECAWFREAATDLFFGEAPGWHQIGGQGSAGHRRFDYPLGQFFALIPLQQNRFVT